MGAFMSEESGNKSAAARWLMPLQLLLALQWGQPTISTAFSITHFRPIWTVIIKETHQLSRDFVAVLNRAQPIFPMRAQLGQSHPQKLWMKGEFSCRKHRATFVNVRQQITSCRSCDGLLPPCTLDEAGYMGPAGALTHGTRDTNLFTISA